MDLVMLARNWKYDFAARALARIVDTEKSLQLCKTFVEKVKQCEHVFVDV